EPQLYKLKNNGKFQVWTRETLIEYGFNPQSASYYLVFHFDNQHPIPVSKPLSFERGNAYKVSIEKYSNFI
ncbi:MAG: site-specific DNA-methyltransferase, partial [Bacteroidales bacterium]|nr:site-specific DNA-methyltransferase [Bacteroidales bacterium]